MRPFAVVALLLVLQAPATAARRAPGIDDAGAFNSGHWSAVLRPGVEFGTAAPWGDLPVRTDWIGVAVGPAGFTLGLEAANTSAGPVQQESLRAMLQSGRGRFRVRAEAERRGVGVEGFAAERTWSLSGSVRVDSAAFALALRLDHESGAVRAWLPAFALETWRGPWRARLQQRSGPFDTASGWSGAGSLALAPGFAVGVGFEPEHTLWSIEARRGGWGLRVGRAVQGPRVGATAVALEWRP